MRSTRAALGDAASTFAYCTSHLNPGIGRTHNLVLDRGVGSYVWDADGKKYLDFGCGIGVTNLGHCHPRLVAAAKKQLDTAWHLQVCTGPHTALHKMLLQLETVFPPTLNNFSFVTTGAEAVEAAMKLSRAATGRQNTAVLQGGYHGRTVGAAAMTTSKYGYARGLRPLMPGIVVLPIPYASQLKCPVDTDVNKMIDIALAQCDDALHQSTHPSEVSMLIAEPMLGEGGYLPLPKRYYQGLRDICTKHGILLAIDEVQSGFGRTGTKFLFEQLVDRKADGSFEEAQLPDVVVFAKGIANGIPLAGIVTRNELAQKQLSGQQGGTYAANPIACATATEVIKVLEEEGILENVTKRSKQLIEGVKQIVADIRAPVMEVRGRGLMVGMQFLDSCPAGTAAAVSKKASDEGMIMLPTSKFETLRFIPPLNVSEAEVNEGLAILRTALKELKPVDKKPAFRPCCEGSACCFNDTPCRWFA